MTLVKVQRFGDVLDEVGVEGAGRFRVGAAAVRAGGGMHVVVDGVLVRDQFGAESAKVDAVRGTADEHFIRRRCTMAEQKDLNELRSAVEALERRLRVPQKQELSKQAAASAEARKNALELPDTQKSRDLASQIADLADSQNVVVEWSAREVPALSAAAVRCCCCCCCCIRPACW
jgi:hypothetical protein